MSKQAIIDHLTVARDTSRPLAERAAALAQAEALRKKAKIAKGKFGDWPEGVGGETQSDAPVETKADDVGETQPTEQSAEQPKPSKKPKKEPDPNRGAIGRLVREMLADPANDYAGIVAKVKEQFPDAKTTARSIASVAADMRRDGIEVTSRRKQKKVAEA